MSFCCVYATCVPSGVVWLGDVTRYGFELQDGTFLVLQPEAIAHNVSGSLLSTGYTVFPGIDFWHSYDLLPLNKTTGGLTCSMDPSASNINITMINECAYPGICCINTGRYQVGE